MIGVGRAIGIDIKTGFVEERRVVVDVGL